MKLALILLLYFVGIVLVVAEMLLPGVVMGLVGLGCVVTAVVLAFQHGGPAYGWILIGVSLVALPLLVVVWIKLLHKYYTVKSSEKEYTAAEAGLAELLGQEGETLTRLRPAGMAQLGGRRVDVVAMGEMIEKGTRVKVVEVRGNRVVVRAAASAGPTT